MTANLLGWFLMLSGCSWHAGAAGSPQAHKTMVSSASTPAGGTGTAPTASTSTPGTEVAPTGSEAAGPGNAGAIRPPRSSGSPVSSSAEKRSVQVALYPGGAWSV